MLKLLTCALLDQGQVRALVIPFGAVTSITDSLKFL